VEGGGKLSSLNITVIITVVKSFMVGVLGEEKI
jgi:hypothetical protein